MKYIFILLSAMASCMNNLRVKNGYAYEASEGMVLYTDSANYDKLFKRLARSEADFMLLIKPVKEETIRRKYEDMPTSINTVALSKEIKVTKVKDKTAIKTSSGERPIVLAKEAPIAAEPLNTEIVKSEIIKPIILKDTLPQLKLRTDSIFSIIEENEFPDMESTKKTKKRKRFLFFKK